MVLEVSVETGQERTPLKLKPGQQMEPSGKQDFLKQLRSREEKSRLAETQGLLWFLKAQPGTQADEHWLVSVLNINSLSWIHF